MKKIIEDLESLLDKLPIPLMIVTACSIATTIMTFIGAIWVLIGEALDWWS